MEYLRPSKPRMRIGGLRGQLLLGLVLLLVLALALVALATTQFHTRHLQQTVADEVQRHAAWLGDLDESTRHRAAASLAERPDVLHAGEIPDSASPMEPNTTVWTADYADRPAVWAIDDSDAPDVAVVLSVEDVQSAADAGQRAILWYLGLTLLFVTLVGYAFFSFVVIRPLRALGVATERAAGGDLASPITVLPRNEFGEVGRQFNQMLDKLQSQQEELERQLEQLQRAHRELKQTQDSLIRSEKMASVGHLAAGVAHEVGNPLAAVMGYTDLLRDRSLDEKTADDLADRMLRQLDRIQKIIRQLLDYSRTESDTEPTAVDLVDVVDEAIHLVEATPEGGDATIEVDVDESLPPVEAIPGQLEQLLVNLLLNAVEAMEDLDEQQALLEIAAGEQDDRVVVDIRDSGPGIDDDVADEIFDPFFTTREPGEGTGLGLAIAQRLIARVDGELNLISSDDGAHFRIRLHRAK